jgi:hypothetical protein
MLCHGIEWISAYVVDHKPGGIAVAYMIGTIILVVKPGLSIPNF